MPLQLVRRFHVWVFLFLLIANPASSANLLLQNAIVHTVSGGIVTNGSVLISGNKIQAVLGHGQKVQSKADRTIDLKGLHLYPGMIALNTALGLTEISGVRSTRDESETGDYTPDVQSWIAINPDSELIPVARANGVTHIQPAPQGGVVSGQSALVVLDGWTMEDLAVKKPVALHIYWPDMGLNTTPKEKTKDQSKWKSPEDQAKERQKKLRELDEYFADARAYAKASTTRNGGGDFDKVPDWEAMLPFLKGELPVMIHANDAREIKSAVTWATTNQLKVIIAGGRDAALVSEFLSTNKVPVVYEHVFTQPERDSASYDAQFVAPELLRKAGVKVITGMGATTFDAGLIKNLPYQAAQAVAFGFPREEAIKSLTLYPAELLGVADRLGSIEPGKEASIFAADGDILDIRSNVKHVWIAGKEVSLENRHTRLNEKYKGRPKAKTP